MKIFTMMKQGWMIPALLVIATTMRLTMKKKFVINAIKIILNHLV